MEKKEYSQSIVSAIKNFLTEDDWHFSFDDQRGLFRFGMHIRGKIRKLRYAIGVGEKEYIVYASPLLRADESDEKMTAAMAEFICCASFGLKNGNFEFDIRDGEIRYKSFVDCADGAPAMEVIRNSILWPAMMFEQYGAGIVDIIYGNLTAKEAIVKCEQPAVENAGSSHDGELDEDAKAMAARLAAKLGADESGSHSDEKQPESSDGEEVKAESVKTKLGGV